MGKKVSIEYLNVSKLLEDKPVDNKAKDHLVLTSTVMDKLQEINGTVLKIDAKIKGRVIN